MDNKELSMERQLSGSYQELTTNEIKLCGSRHFSQTHTFAIHIPDPDTVLWSRSNEGNKILHFFKDSAVLEFVLKVLECNRKNTIECNDGTYILLNVSCPNAKSSKSEIVFETNIQVYKTNGETNNLLTATMVVERFQVLKKNTNDKKYVELLISINEVSKLPIVVTYFGLLSISTIWQHMHQIKSALYDTFDDLRIDMLVPYEWKDSKEYITSSKQYVVNTINHIIENKTDLEDKRGNLLIRGVVPNSIERLGQYLTDVNCMKIEKGCIVDIPTRCNEAKLYKYTGIFNSNLI